MENIPQPADEPYPPGDKVHIYLSDEDFDAQYHGIVCEVLENNLDDLDDLSGRELDKYHYQLRHMDSNEVLPIHFRHVDLVPASEWPKRE